MNLHPFIPFEHDCPFSVRYILRSSATGR